MNISYSLWLYPYAFLINIIFLFASAVAGRIIIGKINLPFFTKLVVYSFTGALSVAAFFALVKCNGITYLLPLVALAAYFFILNIRRHGFNANILTFSTKNFRDAIFIVLPVFLIVFVAVTVFFMPPSGNFIYLNNLDFEFYSLISRKISQYHVESNQWEDIFLYKGARLPYHYADLWLCRIISAVTGVIPYCIYELVIKVYLDSLIVLLLYSLTSGFCKNKTSSVIVSVGTLFIGSTLFIALPANSLPWYLDIDYFPSIINYHGGLMAVTFLCLFFTIMWQGISPAYSYAFLACSGAINVLLYPVIIGYLALNAAIKFILYLLKKESFLIVAGAAIAVIISGIFFFYNMRISSNALAANWATPHSLKVPMVVFSRSIVELLVALIPLAAIITFFYRNWNTRKDFFISIILFFLVIVGEYSFLFESVRGDIWQLKVIGVLPILFFLGYFALVSFLREKKGGTIILYFLILISISCSFLAPLYYFGPGPVFGNGNDRYQLKIKKSDLNEIRSLLLNHGNGFAVLKNNTRQALGIPTGIEVTETCDVDNVIYKLNLVKLDTSTIVARTYIKNTMFRDNPVYMPTDSAKLQPLISKLNLQWGYSDKIHYMPAFLKKAYPNEHNFGDFSIYTKD